MKLHLPDRIISVFTISPRTLDTEVYWKNIETTIELSDKYNYSGNLIFNGNDIYVDTWLVAQTLLNKSSTMSPLVAVNPIYMHPFSAAKIIASFAYIFKRKTCVNCITGTSLNDLKAFNDDLSHDLRYERLKEYIYIIKELLKGELCNFSGRFYTICNMQMRMSVSPELFPEFFISGASDKSVEIAKEIGAVHVRMAKPILSTPTEYPDCIKEEGVYMGIITRPTEYLAWETINKLYPNNEEGKLMQEMAMSNTDSEWKKQLKRYADAPEAKSKNFWMEPFKSFQADCPYFVGDYEQTSNIIYSYVMNGIKTIILDTPAQEDEYRHIKIAFELAKQKLNIAYNSYTEKDSLNIKFKF